MKVLVIGGTLFIGRELVRELVEAGHEVSVLHRKPEHGFGRKVGNLQADRNDPEAIGAALAGRRFEVIFDNVYDWQRGTTAEQVEATVNAAGNHLRRYIFMSSVAAYGDGLNHHEGNALAPDHHPDAYVRNKARTERMLFRMHQRHRTPIVTLRPPFIYGPGNPFYREAFFWDRLRDDRPIILPGDGRRLMQFCYVRDLVWACMKVMESPLAVGHAFNIANARPVTQAELVDALGKVAGRQPDTVRIPRDRILQAGGNPMTPPLYFGVYYDLPAITQVISKAQRMLRFTPTPFPDGLMATYRWYQRNRSKEPRDYSFEDALLAPYRLPPAAALSAVAGPLGQ